jgi:hypothetical protein
MMASMSGGTGSSVRDDGGGGGVWMWSSTIRIGFSDSKTRAPVSSQ